MPVFTAVKVHRDFHARADSGLVRLYHRGVLVKTHPRQQPGRRVTGPAGLPEHKTTYAMRDIGRLAATARGHGEHIGAYAGRLLEGDLPWTRMRQVDRLLGLARRHGPGPVDAACGRALELDVVNVTKIASMLEKATGNTPLPPPPAVAAAGRLARDPAGYRPVQLTLIDGSQEVTP
ncbi:MAG: hypothetical protein ACRDNF_09750 [Streptosporangiaceae bacterium]